MSRTQSGNCAVGAEISATGTGGTGRFFDLRNDIKAAAAVALAAGAATLPLGIAHSAGATSPQGLAPYSKGVLTPLASQLPGTGDSSNFAWATLVLQDGGWSTSANNVNVITEWMRAEEPTSDWWNRYNPLNNGDGSGGGAGLGSYPDLPTAAHFVADNLQTGLNGYAAIENDFNACAAPATTAGAIWNSSWASSHYGHGTDWETRRGASGGTALHLGK